MPIEISALPLKEAYSDKDLEKLETEEKQLISLNLFKDKLSQQSFQNPHWWSSIDGSKLRENKIKIDGHEVYKARLNDRFRILYIAHKLPDKSEHVIVIGYLFKHHGDDIDALETKELDTRKEKLALSIKNHISTLSPTIRANANDDNDDDQQEKTPDHKPSTRIKLSETQNEIFQKSLRESVLLLGLGGGGKTTTITEAIKRDHKCEHAAIYLAPTKGLTHFVAENLSPELSSSQAISQLEQQHILLLTPTDLPNYFHRLAPEIFPLETRRPARYADFEQWYQNTFFKDLKPGQKGYPTANKTTELLRIYREITSELMRPTLVTATKPETTPTTGVTFDSLAQYVSKETYLKNANTRSGATRPAQIYELFEAYASHLKKEKTYYELHNYLWHTFETLRKLTPMELSRLQVDAAYLDEIQCLPTMALYLCLILNRNTYYPDKIAIKEERKKGRANGCNFIAAGDTYQDPTHRETRITQRYQEAFLFFGLNPPTPIILKESFRCSHAIGLISNTLLKTIENTIGSFERSETYGFQVNDENISGNVSCKTHAAMQQLFKTYRQADLLVIIPDDMDRTHAEAKWSGFNILHRSATAGLEEKNVILYGFGDAYAKQLQDIDWKEGEVRFNRKFKAQGGATQEQINIRDALTEIYCAVTRSMHDVIFVDDKINPEIQKLCELTSPKPDTRSDDIKQKAAATTTPSNKATTIKQPALIESIKPMTPIERLEKAKRYLTQGDHNPELISAVSNMLQSSAIWGSNKDLIKQFLERKNFKDLSQEKQLHVIEVLFDLHKRKTASEQKNTDKTTNDFLSELKVLIKELPKSAAEIAADETKEKAKKKTDAAPTTNVDQAIKAPDKTPPYDETNSWIAFFHQAKLIKNIASFAPLISAPHKNGKPSVTHTYKTLFEQRTENPEKNSFYLDFLAMLELNRDQVKFANLFAFSLPPNNNRYKQLASFTDLINALPRQSHFVIAIALFFGSIKKSDYQSPQLTNPAIYALRKLVTEKALNNLSTNEYLLSPTQRTDIELPNDIIEKILSTLKVRYLPSKNDDLDSEKITFFEYATKNNEDSIAGFIINLINANRPNHFNTQQLKDIPGFNEYLKSHSAANINRMFTAAQTTSAENNNDEQNNTTLKV